MFAGRSKFQYCIMLNIGRSAELNLPMCKVRQFCTLSCLPPLYTTTSWKSLKTGALENNLWEHTVWNEEQIKAMGILNKSGKKQMLKRVISCLKRVHAWLEVECLLAIRSIIHRSRACIHIPEENYTTKLFLAKIFRVDCASWTSFCLGHLWEIFFFSSTSLKYSENHVWVYHGSDFTVWWQSYLLHVTAECQCSVVHSLSVHCGEGLLKPELVKSDSWYVLCGWRSI